MDLLNGIFMGHPKVSFGDAAVRTPFLFGSYSSWHFTITAHRSVMKKREATSRKQSSANHHPSDDTIAVRAYEIYMGGGAAQGCDLDDWLQAEQELLTRNKNSVLRHSIIM